MKRLVTKAAEKQMSATIVQETGAVVANANSYVTLAEAELYFETHPQATAWAASSTDSKNRLLITAARVLDNCIKFNGYKVSASQAMQWPRALARDTDQFGGVLGRVSGTTINFGDFPSDAIPKGIKDAQCEMARFLLASNRMDDAPGTGIREFELTGSIRVAFDSGNLQSIVPEFVMNMLSAFGSPLGGKSACVSLTRG